MTAAIPAEVECCIGCGKPLSGVVFCIWKQSVRKNGAPRLDLGEFGTLHEACFLEIVESPESVLREVRRLSRPAKRGR